MNGPRRLAGGLRAGNQLEKPVTDDRKVGAEPPRPLDEGGAIDLHVTDLSGRS